MRWFTFFIFAFVFLILEMGLQGLLGFGAHRDIAPSWMLILMVHTAMFAPARTTAWSAMLLGLFVDLSRTLMLPPPVGEMALIGPHALGFLAGACLTLQIRAMVFRGSPLTLAAVVFVAGVLVNLIAVTMLQLRGVFGFAESPIDWSASESLVDGFLVLLYTAAVAIPIGVAMARFHRAFAFTAVGKMHR